VELVASISKVAGIDRIHRSPLQNIHVHSFLEGRDPQHGIPPIAHGQLPSQ